jgi:hypothetical protein
VVEDIAKIGINVHRTICTVLINTVTGPAVHEELIKDLGKEAYSLIIDASTDVATREATVWGG